MLGGQDFPTYAQPTLALYLIRVAGEIILNGRRDSSLLWPVVARLNICLRPGTSSKTCGKFPSRFLLLFSSVNGELCCLLLYDRSACSAQRFDTPSRRFSKRNVKLFLPFLRPFHPQGLGLAGLVDIVLEVDASILVTALLATTTVFLCFAGAALFSKRRSYLYLGGVLSTGILGEPYVDSMFQLPEGRCYRAIPSSRK